MIHQVVFDTAELLYLKGVRHVVLSPGSRNAPLTISFARHPKLKVYSIIDERSAGFVALGIAQKTQTPVVICCTSGTAMLNYLPAIAEAYYQQIPLIILSADRPPEWIDQRDGQTINQTDAANNFIKRFYQMPVSLVHSDEQWEYNRKLNEAINLGSAVPKGPVHINIPFRDPFYPRQDQELTYSKQIRVIQQDDSVQTPKISSILLKEWSKYSNKLIVIGQHEPDQHIKKVLIALSKKENIPVVTDVISNLEHDQFIKYHDHYLGKLNTDQIEALRPDLLITAGKSIISKNLKLFLRNHRPSNHWHFEKSDWLPDTFQSMTRTIPYDLKYFIEAVAKDKSNDTSFGNQIQSNYFQGWKVLDKKVTQTIAALKGQPFSEYLASLIVANSIPKDHTLHLGNSMPVRYANLVRGQNPEIIVRANRGTSGIDGTNGTAVGDALIAGEHTILWTGDLSFFYDRNAFFHSYDLSGLRIVIMNNQGGGIFRLINGPSSLPELSAYFETKHNHTAKFMAEEFGFDYNTATDTKSLEKGLKQLFNQKDQKKILEIFTEPTINQEVYNKIKSTNYA